MGSLANVSGTLAPANMGGDFKSVLSRSWDRIAAVMPKTMSQERMFQMAVSAVNQTPKLAECSAVSILSCLMKCAALGMEPSNVDGLGRAYVLPFYNKKTRCQEATFILGYKGMLDLARRSGEIKSIAARAVYEGDEFEYEFGLDENLYHAPSLEPKSGRELTHVYCVVKFKDGGHYFNVLSREDVEAARKRSKAGDYGPWATDYEAMALKTAVRRAFPYLPVSVEAGEAAAADEMTPDYSSVLAPVIDSKAAFVADVETGTDEGESGQEEPLEQPTEDFEEGEAL